MNMKTPQYLLAPLALLAAAAFAADPRVNVPVPTVTGPVAWTAQPPDASHGYTFNHTFLDLAHSGYVEEEFFIEGTANRYNMPAEATGSVIDIGHPYTTRIVVRRPTSARKFNGTAIVEWTNVTGSRDLEMDWFQSSEHFIRAGYAWIGVSAQHVGVDALKVWSPGRYGTLDVTEGGKITNDALSYDIMAATAEAVRGKSKTDVMGGLKVERVIASGHSQSAGRLAGYVNSVYPLNPVFDGVMLHGGGGKIRADLKVKVWKMLSETDVRGPAARQDDTGSFRTWEVAGTSHVDSESARALRGDREIERGCCGQRRGRWAMRSSDVQPGPVPLCFRFRVRSHGGVDQGWNSAAVGAADPVYGREASGDRTRPQRNRAGRHSAGGRSRADGGQHRAELGRGLLPSVWLARGLRQGQDREFVSEP